MAELSTKRILGAREEVLVSLRKQHGGLMKKINTERKKLDTFKEDIRTISGKAQGALQKKFQELREKKDALKATYQRCATSKVFTKAERKDFYWMQEELDEVTTDTFGPAFNMSEEELAQMARQAAEERHQRGFDFYDQFTPPVPEAEQKSIREVYKRLAAKFHPDKASGNDTLEQRFHTIMQRINTSYQRGDIADLLAIESEYTEMADILAQADSPLVDVIEREIERLRNEIELCSLQLERLKTERKKLERSHDGKMIKDYKKAEKQGVDPIQEMTADLDQAITGMQQQIDLFERLLSGEITKDQFIEESNKLMPMDMNDEFEDDFSPFGDTREVTPEELMEILAMLERQAEPPRSSRSGRASAPKRGSRR